MFIGFACSESEFVVQKEFHFTRAISYYETDAMGVVHHSNFIRIFEDARVAWLRERGLSKIHAPHGDVVFAVVSANCQYKRPLRFGDFARVRLQAQAEGAKIKFRYAIYRNEDKEPSSIGDTLHIAVDSQMKVTKPPQELVLQLKEEPWTEIWP